MKILLLTLYVIHLLFFLGGVIFIVSYFGLGSELLAEGLSSKDQRAIHSLNLWHIIVAGVYPALMFAGIHLLCRAKGFAAHIYLCGGLLYLLSNAASYGYAKIQGYQSTASLEDLGFSIITIGLVCLVYMLSKKMVALHNA